MSGFVKGVFTTLVFLAVYFFSDWMVFAQIVPASKQWMATWAAFLSAAAAAVWVWRKAPQARKYVMGALASGFLFLTFFGFAPGTDVVAHVGGFAIGLILGAALAGRISRPARRRLNVASALLFAVFVILPWWMEMRKPS